MDNVKIHFLNTIWSDCEIIEANGHYAFIDTASGFYFPMVQKYMKDHNINKIDFILLTHFHSDHYGNIINLVENYEVGEVYFREYSHHEGVGSSGEISNDEYLAKENKKNDDIIAAINKNSKLIMLDEKIKHIKFECLDLDVCGSNDPVNEVYNDETSPYYHQDKFSDNYKSVSVFFRYNGVNVYIAGDMTNSASSIPQFNRISSGYVKQLYEKYGIDHMDIYKTAHHGGSGNNDPELLKLIKPSYAIITNTDKWLDNWPTRGYLKDANPDVEILQTDRFQYIFDINNGISVDKILDESLFITLNKD